MEALSHIGLLGELSKQAQGARVTVGMGAKFDDSAVRAYSKELGDGDLQRLSAAAPKHFSPSEKVRFMELIASLLPNDSMDTGN